LPKSGAAPKSDSTVRPCEATPLASRESSARPEEGASEDFAARLESVCVPVCVPVCDRCFGCAITSGSLGVFESASATLAGSFELFCARDSFRAPLWGTTCGIAGPFTCSFTDELTGALLVEFTGALADGAEFPLTGGITAFAAGEATAICIGGATAAGVVRVS
jgi:hypothetical protein